MFELLADPGAWLSFVTLSVLEIVLGVDNIIFLSILVGRLPAAQQASARVTGLALAMLTRIALLFSIVWLTRLTTPWFTLGPLGVSGRDLILFVGGVFLVVKSAIEIHHSLQGAAQSHNARALASFAATVVQIAIIDIVFSLDSVFTAVGLANELAIMVAAIIIAIGVMMWLAGGISAFIEHHPTVKMLALAFLILVGAALMAEGFHYEISKGYLYFAMAFSAAVELLNIRLRKLLDTHRPRPLQ